MFERVFTGAQAWKILQEITHLFSSLKADVRYELSVKLYRKKRSIDANNYCWALLSKMADALTAEAQGDEAYSKDDVYLDMLKRYGQGGIVKIQTKDVEKFTRAHKYCEEHETLFDDSGVYYRFWVGSSNYSTHEMSLFINGIVAECKAMQIETKTPAQLAGLLEAWDEAQADKGNGHTQEGEGRGVGA